MQFFIFILRLQLSQYGRGHTGLGPLPVGGSALSTAILIFICGGSTLSTATFFCGGSVLSTAIFIFESLQAGVFTDYCRLLSPTVLDH